MTYADTLNAQADAYDQEALASFERCDTDGALSQWGLRMNADLNRLKARIFQNGGVSTFTGLYQGDRRVKARIIDTKFGIAWLLHEDEADLIAARGKPFLPTGPNSYVLAGLGLCERDETDAAYAKVGDGCMSTARPVVLRKGDQWGQNAVLIK